MSLQKAFHTYLYLFAAFVAATPSPNPDFDDSHLPDLRLSRDEVQALKEAQIHPPGYVQKYITFGNGSDAVTVPIVEADVDILLDDEQGVKARSLASRGGSISCMSFPTPRSGCMIDYCWRDDEGVIYSRAITITGSNGQSNPISVTSNDPANLGFNEVFNDGYRGWFRRDHECSNSNTQIYTDHRLLSGVMGTAYIHHVRCENCHFGGLKCLSDVLKNNLIAYSNGVSSQSSC
jgi:hypothetical protein